LEKNAERERWLRVFGPEMKKTLRIAAGLLLVLGLICLVLFFLKGAGAGKLTWESPTVRKSLMTFAYKIYANPAAENGRYFLSKMVFRNDGTAPVRDFSVSYQIPDYLPWTTPETHAEISPGQTVVQLFYPQLPSKVTQLSSQTTATLETKIRWADKSGETKEEILRSNVELRGVNEIEYTDLPANEILTWYDVFVTSPFAVAMVTPNDPVVKEFAAEITKRTGGTMAGIAGGPEEIIRLMKAMYDYMCETGMRYTSDQGVPSTMGDVRTMVQTVRLPRDVIITNEGLCVELALLWASVMEHLGCHTTVVFRPGHAFTVVWVGKGPNDFVPIECTAITPMAVGAKKPVPFEEAVKMAQQDIREQKYQIWLGVQEYQKEGFHAPELPGIEIDKIKNILAQRGGHTAAAYAQAQAAGPTGSARTGYFRWRGANGLVSIDVPENWTRLENSPIPGMVFTAQDVQSTVAVNVFYFPNFQSASDAMQAAQRGVASYNHGRVHISSQQAKGNAIYYTGTTSHQNGTSQWVGVFAPTPAGVIGFFTGSAKGTFERNQPIIQDVISSAHFGE
jgi:hypothetical protein